MVAMPLLIDENVPESVTAFLRDRGHNMAYVRELFLSGTPDGIIAAVADKRGWIIVTWDADFRTLAQRTPRGGKGAYKRMGRISFRCNEANGLRRAQACIESIEFEYGRRLASPDSRLIVEITETTFTVVG